MGLESHVKLKIRLKAENELWYKNFENKDTVVEESLHFHHTQPLLIFSASADCQLFERAAQYGDLIFQMLTDERVKLKTNSIEIS